VVHQVSVVCMRSSFASEFASEGWRILAIRSSSPMPPRKAPTRVRSRSQKKRPSSRAYNGLSATNGSSSWETRRHDQIGNPHAGWFSGTPYFDVRFFGFKRHYFASPVHSGHRRRDQRRLQSLRRNTDRTVEEVSPCLLTA